MAYDGSLKFDTSMDTKGFQQGADSLGNIVKGMTAFKLLEAGFRAIVGSIDAAVSRYDTLNRFPQIMEKWGYSTEQAGAATKKLSEGIDGLPTTLDEIVSNTKQLTVATGGLDTGVDSALALNNAFLASGATSAEASRGMTQYIQMLSSGKVDMQSWKTLNETMTYALQKTAEAFGFTGASAKNDLYAALRDGEITMAEFNAKIIELNGGVGGFAEVAKTSTGGIGTAWTNLKTAIVRGTAGIIESIDRGLSKTRFQSIENVINKMKDGITKALSAVAKAFEFVAENAEIILPLLVGIGAAVAAWRIGNVLTGVVKGFQTAALQVSLYTAAQNGANFASKAAVLAAIQEGTALTTKEVIVGVLTKKIGIATAAQYLWNAAMQANPIGLIMTLIVAAIAVIVALAAALDKGSEAYQQQKEKVTALKDAYDELDSKMEESKAAHAENQMALEAQSSKGQQLIGTLGKLSAITDKTGEDTLQLSNTVDDLNSTYEGLNLTVEEFNNNPAAAKERAEDFARLSDAVNKADLALERQNELVQEELEAQAGLDQIEVQRREIAALVEAGNMSYHEASKLLWDLHWAEKDYNDALEDNAVLQAANAEAAQDAAVIQERALLNREKALNGAVDAEGRNLKQLAQAWSLTEDQILDAMDQTGKDLAEWSADNQKFYTQDGKNLAQVAKQWGVTESEIEKYIDEMGTDISGYVAYQESLVTESGMNLDMVAEKWGMTTDEVTALMDEWGFTLDDVNEHMKETHTDMGESVEDLAAKYGVSVEEINKWMVMNDETAQGWKDHQIDLFDEWRDAASGGIDTVVNGFEEIPAAADISLSELTSIMEKNNERNMAWKQNLVTASRTLGPEMMQVISSWGPEYNSLLEEYLADPNGELGQKFYNQMKTAAEMEVGAYEDTLPQFQAAGDQAGDVLGSGVGTGLSESTAPTAASQEIADSVVANISNADFSAITTGIADAIRSGTSKVTSAVTSLNTAVQGVFRVMSSQVKYTTQQMMTAVHTSITSKAGAIKAAISSIGTSIATALNTAKTQAASIAQQMMTSVNSAITSRAGSIRSSITSIGTGITTALNTTKTQATSTAQQMMTAINTAITSKTAVIRASITSIGDAITKAFTAAKTQATTIAQQMMDGIKTAITSRTAGITSAASGIASGVESNLRSMIEGCKSVMGSAMDGMLWAMNNKASALYAKAREIANNIARTMRSALDVHSPSRVMIKIFENVMMGIYKGMDGMKGLLYKLSEGISIGISERLAIPEDSMQSMFESIGQGVSLSPALQASSYAPSLAGASAGGTTHTTTNAPVLQFYEPVNSPDIVAKRTAQVFRYGLAGDMK